MANRVYEVMFIVQAEKTAEDVTKLIEGVQKLVEAEGGSVVRIDDMGKRRLAYEIKRKKEGYYVLFEIEGSGKEIAEIERRFRVNDAVIRYITVRVDEDRKAAEKIRAKRTSRRSKKLGESEESESTEVQENQ